MEHKLLLLLLIPMILVVANIMSFFLDDYEHDFSLTQRYRTYYALYNWNLPVHAYDDFDGDGKKDEIAFNGCAHLSSFSQSLKEKGGYCNTSEATNYIVDPDINKETPGQNLPFGDPSFLVKTKSGRWRHYAYDLFNFTVHELGEDRIFHKVSPTVLDIIDYISYMPSHFLLITLPF